MEGASRLKTRDVIVWLATAVAFGISAAGLNANANVMPNDNWYFNGAVHPYGNPHWCFYGAVSSQVAIVTGTPVVLEKCKSTSKKTPIAGEYWHGYRIRAVGQMFLLAKPNYVLGRFHRKPPVVFVPFEYTRDANNFIAFLRDRHGEWHLELTDQNNKKPYYLIMPEHLKASVTAYPLKWREADQGVPRGYTDVVILPRWEQVQTV